MPTRAQYEANRTNARLSTGPKSVKGKASARRNALKHGLNIPITQDRAISPRIEALALRILGDDGSTLLPLAREAAEAQLEVDRARAVRHHLLLCVHEDPEFDRRKTLEFKAAIKPHIYREDFVHDGSLIGSMRHALAKMLRRWFESNLSVPRRFSIAFLEMGENLRRLDRYERRAIARRTLAIRALDEARKTERREL